MTEFGGGSNSSNFSNINYLYVDTSLGTYLGLSVHQNENISDFKDKFCLEHKECFPNYGDIKILALKVKRRGHYYELLDMMTMMNIFGHTGVGRDWFMSADAVMEEVKKDQIVQRTLENGAGEKKKKKKRKNKDVAKSPAKSPPKSPAKSPAKSLAKSPAKSPTKTVARDTPVDSGGHNIDNETRKNEQGEGEVSEGATNSRYMLRSSTKQKKATPSDSSLTF